jgi:hypothetical protein
MATNVTVSLGDDILRAARHLAVDRGMSLSKFLATILEERLQQEAAYEQAKEIELRRMAEGLDLGTGGNITWTRDSLHER